MKTIAGPPPRRYLWTHRASEWFDRERMANRYPSLRKLALPLYSAGSTLRRFSTITMAPRRMHPMPFSTRRGTGARRYLIFGGYLNTTQQYSRSWRQTPNPAETTRVTNCLPRRRPSAARRGVWVEVMLHKLVNRIYTFHSSAASRLGRLKVALAKA